MEKLGVQIDQEKIKEAEKTGARRCPRCGAGIDTEGGSTAIPKCPNCGTEPFEKRSSENIRETARRIMAEHDIVFRLLSDS